jgi:hypothetical protein
VIIKKKIAFSNHSIKQILLNAPTLEQTMTNKIQAFLDREEVRDCFDIEFLLRRGIDLPVLTHKEFTVLQKKIGLLKDADFKVKLGSILEKDMRDYYAENKFSFLEEKLTALNSG